MKNFYLVWALCAMTMSTLSAAEMEFKAAETSQSNSKSKTVPNSEYVDLGLPSGTKWTKENEKGFYEFDAARLMEKDGKALPTQQQFQELLDECQWKWEDGNRRGYTITGPNGKSIFLPADGYFDYYNDIAVGKSNEGYYWSRTESGSRYAYQLFLSRLCSYSINRSLREYGGSIRMVLESKTAETIQSNSKSKTVPNSEYVDLGLPSGTIWKKENEKGLYKFDAARLLEKDGKALPTQQQLQELLDECQWEWEDGNRRGYTVIGPNGKSIFLPADGYFRHGIDEVYESNRWGCYWSRTVESGINAYGYYFNGLGCYMERLSRSDGQSVRMVLVR